MRHEWFNGRIPSRLYRYDPSPIVWPDGTPAPPLETQTYTQTARPGARAPHVRLPDGRSTQLDLFRARLRAAAGWVPTRRAARVWCGRRPQAGIPVTVVAFDLHAGAQKPYQRALVLVRPDGHAVAWRADAEPRDAGAVVDAVRGAKPIARESRGRRLRRRPEAVYNAGAIAAPWGTGRDP